MVVTYVFKTIRKGSTGGHVRTVQAILSQRGFKGIDGKDLKPDGVAGDNTMYAIKCYIEARKAQGADLGSTDAWGPRCYADQNWPTA